MDRRSVSPESVRICTRGTSPEGWRAASDGKEDGGAEEGGADERGADERGADEGDREDGGAEEGGAEDGGAWVSLSPVLPAWLRSSPICDQTILPYCGRLN